MSGLHLLIMTFFSFLGAYLGLRALILAAYCILMIFGIIRLDTFLNKYVAQGITNIADISEANVLAHALVILFLLIIFILVGRNLFQFFALNVGSRWENRFYGLGLGAVIGYLLGSLITK